MQHESIISSESSSGVVRGLVRKYSSDSEASPGSRPPEKKKLSDASATMNPTNLTDGNATGTPAAASSTSGGVGTPQTQQPSSSVNPMPAVTDFASVGIVLNQINLSIAALSNQLSSTRDSLTTRITNLEQSLTTKITTECDKLRTDVMLEVAAVDAKVMTLTTSFSKLEDEFKSNTDRLKIVEDALAEAGALTPDFFPENTVIATGLSYSDPEDIKKKAQDLINALTSACTPPLPQIDVINAMRTPSRNNKPGVVKIQLPSRQNKIDILKNKKKLSGNTAYARVFIRGSQSHTDRLIHLNTNTLLNELGLNDRYRVAANGRLVLKSDDDTRPGYYQPHMQQPPQRFQNGPPSGPPGQFHVQQHAWPRPGGQRPPAPMYANNRPY